MCRRYLVRAFCKEYPINQESNEAGEPGSECSHVSRCHVSRIPTLNAGILIGRYPNDGYAGGNPWQLLTAVTAECFYVGAQITYQVHSKRSAQYSEKALTRTYFLLKEATSTFTFCNRNQIEEARSFLQIS